MSRAASAASFCTRARWKLANAVERKGMTIVPLELYFNKRGIAKLKLALAEGKKLHDKREAAAKRDWNRQKARIMRDKG